MRDLCYGVRRRDAEHLMRGLFCSGRPRFCAERGRQRYMREVFTATSTATLSSVADYCDNDEDL